MDSGEFRQALGQFATGVCLVTVNDPELGPPCDHREFVLICVTGASPRAVEYSKHSDHLKVYSECTHFGISVLSAEQADLWGIMPSGEGTRRWQSTSLKALRVSPNCWVRWRISLARPMRCTRVATIRLLLARSSHSSRWPGTHWCSEGAIGHSREVSRCRQCRRLAGDVSYRATYR